MMFCLIFFFIDMEQCIFALLVGCIFAPLVARGNGAGRRHAKLPPGAPGSSAELLAPQEEPGLHGLLPGHAKRPRVAAHLLDQLGHRAVGPRLVPAVDVPGQQQDQQLAHRVQARLFQAPVELVRDGRETRPARLIQVQTS
ncbi:MAG: hypothetical protein DCC59_16380 [Chloroflexi bacterium]|nr:MAG: hypothetical protein DCC59_16380 [Chloroflexota bacterium]